MMAIKCYMRVCAKICSGSFWLFIGLRQMIHDEFYNHAGVSLIVNFKLRYQVEISIALSIAIE